MTPVEVANEELEVRVEEKNTLSVGIPSLS